MYQVTYTKKFQKSLLKIIKRDSKKTLEKSIKIAVECLASGEKLDPAYRDHKLQGELSMYRECHIQGDLLLVYQIVKDQLILVLVNIGSHNDIFNS